MDFGEALSKLRDGERVSRTGWNGVGMYVALQTPDDHSKMELPYLYIFTAQGQHVPWVASHSDLLGTDWVSYG